MNGYGKLRAQPFPGAREDAARPRIWSMDLANETNGVNGNVVNGVNGQPRSPMGFDDLPYFQEYLQSVLRPKIERAIEALDRSLTEAAWRHIIATVATDQHIAADVATSIVRPLLEQKLGLRMQAKLESQWGAAAPMTPGTPPAVDMGEGMMRAAGVDGPDVLTVRRRPVNNPIGNAVASNPRPLGR